MATDREKLPYAELSHAQPPALRRHRDWLDSLQKLLLGGLVALIAIGSGRAAFDSLFVPTHSAHPAPIRGGAYTAAKSRLLSAESQTAWQQTVDRCLDLHTLPGPPREFHERTESDRYEPETTRPVLIRNATIWTGDHNATVLYATDILLDRGLIIDIGEDLRLPKQINAQHVEIVDAHGGWITPGIFDMHSHVGVDALPSLSATDDTNSVAGPIQPQLRTIDAINAHDLAYKRSAAGGVTTSLILPGSANNIGGQAFLIKLRPTKERTIDSLALEFPFNVQSTSPRAQQQKRRRADPPRWRHMKHACGENIRNVYSQTRLDLAWNFRKAYDEARTLKRKQDRFCERAIEADRKGAYLVAGKEGEVEEFPDDLGKEALVDVLRGKVKVNTHCYTIEDLNSFVRHTNEFEFPVAAFHHAHETYLVPDLLKASWPGNGSKTPAVALFSINGRYKREAWFGSKYAGKVLAESDIPVTYVSDHPVTDSRYLLYQAQQAHHYGLDADLALASITSTPARIAGMDHRVGSIRRKFDADVVLWTDHPLRLGATPQQVWIDGIAQIVESFPPEPVKDPAAATPPPQASLPSDYNPLRQPTDDGFDFLLPGDKKHTPTSRLVDRVLFTNISEVILPGYKVIERGQVERPLQASVVNGDIVCLEEQCELDGDVETINLQGGALLPPLVTYGSAIGLTDIISEKSTTDANVPDPLSTAQLSPLQRHFADRHAVRAADALAFGGKQLETAERNGVRVAVTAPLGKGFFRGKSVAFKTGADNVLEDGAIVKEIAALHIQIGHLGSAAPVALEIGELRRLLLPKQHDSAPAENAFSDVTEGRLPLVIHADKADVLATLVNLKAQVEQETGRSMRWVIHGGAEAYLVAEHLARADIGVVLTRAKSFPATWDSRRALPGPPLTPDTATTILHEAGVRLAFGVEEEWEPSSLLWEAAWAHKLSRGKISRTEAVKLVSHGVEDLFDISSDSRSFVAYERDVFEFGARALAASEGKVVKIFP